MNINPLDIVIVVCASLILLVCVAMVIGAGFDPGDDEVTEDNEEQCKFTGMRKW